MIRLLDRMPIEYDMKKNPVLHLPVFSTKLQESEPYNPKKRKTIEVTFDGFILLVQIETLLKAINTSAGIYQLLLTGEERVTLRTNVNYDILLSRASLDDIAASATNGRLLIIGMDSLLHVVSPLSGYALQSYQYDNMTFIRLQALF